MFDPDSRYADSPVETHETADGREVRFVRRRRIPAAGSTGTVGKVVVHDGERLDQIAARSIGDPGSWWRLADANEAMEPVELVETAGAEIDIPSPF